MKVYLAGVYTANFDIGGNGFRRLTPAEQEKRASVKNILESFHYVKRKTFVAKMRKDGVKVFLDSGAFSAFTKGVDVDLPGYCEYIKENMDIIYVEDGDLCASVLDGIGDPYKTYVNQLAMEKLGVRPLPCFHFGEDERYLEFYIANYRYITIGGMVHVSTGPLKVWLDRIWEKYLTKSDGTPKLKVHGFGLTTESLMERYPWFSVDSSSWVQMAANGAILLPGYGCVFISARSPSAKCEGRHLDTIPQLQREALVKLIEKSGFTVERLQHEYLSRWTHNLWAFGEYNNMKTPDQEKFIPDQIGLF